MTGGDGSEASHIPAVPKLRSLSWNLAVAEQVSQVFAVACNEAWARFAQLTELPTIVIVPASGAVESFGVGAYRPDLMC